MPRSDEETNYVHAATNWTQRLEEETKAAYEWKANWGFLANKPLPPPRGFSTSSVKHVYGGVHWSLEQKRIPDDGPEGIAAATAERDFRMRKRDLTWQSRPTNLTKPCEAKGAYTGMTLVETDTSGVKNREAALLSA